MSKYRMDDGTVVDTDKSSDNWVEDSYWDGSNHISKATGSQWEHQRLYRSRKGRYYVERTSDWQGSRPHVEWVSNEEATRWLLANDQELPADLKHLEAEIVE
jgi:hypothetical protein